MGAPFPLRRARQLGRGVPRRGSAGIPDQLRELDARPAAPYVASPPCHVGSRAAQTEKGDAQAARIAAPAAARPRESGTARRDPDDADMRSWQSHRHFTARWRCRSNRIRWPRSAVPTASAGCSLSTAGTRHPRSRPRAPRFHGGDTSRAHCHPISAVEFDGLPTPIGKPRRLAEWRLPHLDERAAMANRFGWDPTGPIPKVWSERRSSRPRSATSVGAYGPA